ncbi:hypothetical protein JAAARDRAFT_192971 [Jaapia argillacea MUCL 33604]|uniref:Uncharacterized protein n=1 Tax=Jaapia argillacea MUCL 33604 TaxID=933084 RepID=A0A067PUA1_9AGAM|nr:hypothetical protein JAAARDRAFT_192971 [Jaapia argillacea MUCL 33604]
MAPVAVLACEKDCMDGVTQRWIDNYALPIQTLLTNIGNQINQLVPPTAQPPTVTYFLQPVQATYNSEISSALETAIFPSYFHGKCQLPPDFTINPPGCPNPNCPVVCGTPGSLVHFYGKLRYIAYNTTLHMLENLVKPGSETYKEIEQTVLEHTTNPPPRMFKRFIPRGSLIGNDYSKFLKNRRSADVKSQLQVILKSLGPQLEKMCGGNGDGTTNGLPDCSWEQATKAYILTFP